jgi:hypothetical protein
LELEKINSQGNPLKSINNNSINRDENIDKAIIEIIIALIKNRKFEDYENALKIINQLDLEKIQLTDIMIQGLTQFFNSNENFINDYMINHENDLYNIKKIHFYYILLKYILKSQAYINQFSLLLNTRKIIRGMLENNKINFENIYNNIIKNDIIYVIKFIVDSEDYIKKYIENNEYKRNIDNQLNEILKYYRYFYFESKKNEINEIEDIIKGNKDNYDNYLQDYDTAKAHNNLIPIINYLYLDDKNNNNIIKEKDIEDNLKKYRQIERMIKEDKINKIKGKNKIFKYFSDNNNRENLLNIFSQDKYG